MWKSLILQRSCFRDMGPMSFDIPTHLNHLQDEGQAWIVSTYRAGNVNLESDNFNLTIAIRNHYAF